MGPQQRTPPRSYSTLDPSTPDPQFQNLKTIKRRTALPLVLLVNEVAPDSGLTHLQLTTDKQLDRIARVCAGLGPSKDFIVHTNAEGTLAEPTSLVARAHTRGLQVHPYTFRNEAQYLAFPLFADPRQEYDLQFKRQGINGGFTDNPATLADYFAQVRGSAVLCAGLLTASF